MKRSIARKWAQALESGEYKQGTGQLRKGDKFCALGVLCNLHAQEYPEIATKEKVKSRYLGASTELPLDVMVWAGMTSSNGYISCGNNVVNMNDGLGMTFKEIAKVVRKKWAEL
jgi:hypothetical protein